MKRFCRTCGKEFYSINADDFCSVSCRKEVSGERYCPICGTLFKPKSKQQKYCSGKCIKISVESRRLRKNGQDVDKKQCRMCGKEFDATADIQRQLCPECEKKVGSDRILFNRKDDWNDDRVIERYGKKDVDRARYHEHLISADERMRKSLGISTRTWGYYKDNHKDVVDAIRADAGVDPDAD